MKHPSKVGQSDVLKISIKPPPNQGYKLECDRVQPLGFPELPKPLLCVAGETNADLHLTFYQGNISKGGDYTFGIGVLNPGGVPAEDMNYWGVLLSDENSQIFDGNLRINGLALKNMPIIYGAMGWSSSMPQVLATIQLQLRVTSMIGAGLVTAVCITAPNEVMYSRDPSKVKVLPRPLPNVKANPTTVDGERLFLNIDEQQPIEVGYYNIRFEITTPGTIPWDNTWTIEVKKGVVVEWSYVVRGFELGEESVFGFANESNVSGTATRQAALGSGVAIFLLLMYLLHVAFLRDV
jgi:hypothetical protein